MSCAFLKYFGLIKDSSIETLEVAFIITSNETVFYDQSNYYCYLSHLKLNVNRGLLNCALNNAIFSKDLFEMVTLLGRTSKIAPVFLSSPARSYDKQVFLCKLKSFRQFMDLMKPLPSVLSRKTFSFSIDTVFTLCARIDLSERS